MNARERIILMSRTKVISGRRFLIGSCREKTRGGNEGEKRNRRKKRRTSESNQENWCEEESHLCKSSMYV